MVRLVVVLVVLATLPTTTAGAAPEDLEQELEETREQREALTEELEETRQREGELTERLRELDARLDEAQAELEERRTELAAAEQEHDRATDRAREARAELRAVRAELDATEQEYTEARGQLQGRVRSAYMYGQVSFVDTFTGVRDVADFLNSTTYVSHVMEGDRHLVEQVETLLLRIGEQRDRAQELRVEAEREADAAAAAAEAADEAAAEQAGLTEQVRTQREERAALLEELREDRHAMEGHLEGLEEESARIESELAEIARQQREQRERERAAARASGETLPAANGAWLRPVGGHVTSTFGPRWGRNHNGVDLAGGVGTSVVAARNGVVVTAISSCHPTSSWGCGGGFGNYVTVSHADGTATIYAHLSAVAVGTGQQVAAGQGIGQLGNSGNSYGPHLHFEVRDAGRPRNPCNYIRC